MSLLNSASLVVTPNGYKEGTLYSVIPNTTLGDMTVVRATTATRVNSAGLIESVAINVPRLDYLNASCPSLLLEPQRTNLALYSEQMDNAAWTKLNGTVSANQAEAPDGTISADLFYPTTSGADRLLAQPKTGTIGQTFTSSAFVKSSGVDWVLFYAANLGACWFNASTGVFGTVGSGVTASVLGQVNGFWRISLTATIANTNVYFYIGTANANGTNTITKNGTDGILVWGAQVELGSYATSYIPTTSAAVTRNADAISKTGISSLIGQTEGTIYLEADIQKHNNTDFYIAISNGSTLAEAIYLQQPSSGNLNILFRTSSLTRTIIVLSANWNIGYNKIAIAYNSSLGEVFINGVSKGTVVLTAIPTCNQIVLGSRPDAPGQLVGSGGYKVATLFPTRLTNAELAQLTTI